MRKKPKAEFDKAWKEILGLHFEDFISFFFPQVHAQIVWGKGFQFLDKELHQIARSAKIGTRFADKLVQVQTKQYGAVWVLIHIEVQSYKDAEFAERMFIYYYKIYDRFKMKVASLAILGDTNSKWRPSEFNTELLNCQLSLKFPMVKLADYEGREEALEEDKNPFATVVLTHLAAKKNRDNPDSRFANMFAIAQRMSAKGYDQDTVNSLLRFMDWVVALPEELEIQLRDKIHQHEESLPMQHVTFFERLAKAEGKVEGKAEGKAEGLKFALELKFGKKGLELLPIIAKLKSPKEQTTFRNRLKTAQTPAELKKFYK
jgi:predicted transposase YdaD